MNLLKNNNWSLLMGLTGLLLLNSCGDNYVCEKGEGDVVTRELTLPSFTGIKMSGKMNVFIEQGSTQSVSVEAQENIIDLLELDVQDDTWEIEFDECVEDADQMKIYITLPEIEYISLSGSGRVRSDNTLVGDRLVLRLSGSGSIDLSVDLEDLDSRISGSGEIILEGDTDKFDFETSGSGDYSAFDMAANSGDIKISGSGDSEVRVFDVLDIEISGSGDVLYKGEPTLSLDITGSGDVINAN